MATINNSQIIQKATNDLKIEVSREKIPTQINEKINLSYNLNSKQPNLIKTGNITTTSSLTLALTSTKHRTFFTGFEIGFVKDSTCDVASGATVSFAITVDGKTLAVGVFPMLTLTAQDGYNVFNFSEPILLDKNTVVALNPISFTAGALIRSAVIYLKEEF